MAPPSSLAPSTELKVTTLRLSDATLARARSPRLARHVAERLELDGLATMADVLRLAVRVGLGALERDALGERSRTVLPRYSSEERARLAAFEREVLPRLRELLGEEWKSWSGKAAKRPSKRKGGK